MKKIKNIAIVAFDSAKTDLIEWSYFNKDILIPHNITALGFAANILEGTLNKKINCIEPGNFGGYRQLHNLINANKIDALIIFGDAEEIMNTKYLKTLFETAIEHNIIVAANKTTADFLLQSSLIDAVYTISKKEKKQLSKTELLGTHAAIALAKAS